MTDTATTPEFTGIPDQPDESPAGAEPGINPETGAPEATPESGQPDDGSPTVVDPDTIVELPDGTQTTWGELNNERLRHQDYTTKTQEVADLRREAQTGLSIMNQLYADPAGTLQTLERYVSDTMGVQLNRRSADDDDFEIEDPDPRDQQLAQLQQQVQQLQRSQTNSQVQAEFAAIQRQDPHVDAARLANTVRETGLPIAQAYKIMKFDELQGLQQRQQQLAPEKRQNAKVVSTGSAGRAPTGASQPDRFAEAKNPYEVGEGVLEMLREEGKLQ